MKGKIIVITGGPRTGKSTLVQALGERLGVNYILEGEESDFPERVIEDIKTGNRILELLTWFRNKGVEEYLEAMKTKKEGGVTILDAFWATNDVYVDEWVSDEFQEKILKKQAAIDYNLLPWPDLVVSLYSDREKIKQFAIDGDREFELNDDYLDKQVNLNEKHRAYFEDLEKPNIEFFDRSNSDFLNDDEIENFIKFMEDSIGTDLR